MGGLEDVDAGFEGFAEVGNVSDGEDAGEIGGDRVNRAN